MSISIANKKNLKKSKVTRTPKVLWPTSSELFEDMARRAFRSNLKNQIVPTKGQIRWWEFQMSHLELEAVKENLQILQVWSKSKLLILAWWAGMNPGKPRVVVAQGDVGLLGGLLLRRLFLPITMLRLSFQCLKFTRGIIQQGRKRPFLTKLGLISKWKNQNSILLSWKVQLLRNS